MPRNEEKHRRFLSIRQIGRSLRRTLGRLIPYRLVHKPHLSKQTFDPNLFDILPKDQYDYIPKGQYDCIPKGQYDCIPKGCVYGPADQYLLVPKNRYRVVLRPGQPVRRDTGIGWVTEANTPDAYDSLWGDPDARKRFYQDDDRARERLTSEIVDHVADRIPADASVLDVGCGAGDLLGELARRRPDIQAFGCDFSPRAIETAEKRINQGRFQCCEIADSLPYPTNGFEVVFSTDFLEHIEQPVDIVKEMVRIVRAKGMVVIVVPDGDVDQFLGHVWFWNESSLRQLLSPWNADVFRLPESHEFMAIIVKDVAEDTCVPA